VSVPAVLLAVKRALKILKGLLVPGLVKLMLFVPFSVEGADTVKLLPIDIGVLACKNPPFKVKAPVPNAPVFPKINVPAVNVVPPL